MHQSNGTGGKGPANSATPGEFPIAIIGAGFAGIGTAIQLKKAGIESFTMSERAGEIGGTWRDNTYPGAACDVPSHVYSFSFEQKADWTRAFAESAEIEQYLLDLVAKWGLRSHLRLNTEIVEARFDEVNGTWSLRTNHGDTFVARAVVAGVGGLVDPAWPDIEGLESFVGTRFHTARWNHDYELAGKRVGVIGTGASAVQVVPAIAAKVAGLKVFQRTPAWVMPKIDHVYTDRQKRFYRRHPRLLDLSRKLKYWLSELFGPIVFLDNERLSRVAERQSLLHLKNSVKNPELRRKLTPNFQFGCKRVLISSDYWATFERENVDLVTEGIERITANGIETTDGTEHELDAIICATGFALGLAKSPFPVFGRGGKSLDDVWSNGAEAYKGMTVSGFPNWFILMGPNTGPGHTSVLVYTEAQISHALQAIETMRREGIRILDIKQSVQDAYNANIQQRMKHMVWSTGCHPWYLSSDGSNHALYPGFAFRYVLSARTFNRVEYEIVR